MMILCLESKQKKEIIFFYQSILQGVLVLQRVNKSIHNIR